MQIILQHKDLVQTLEVVVEEGVLLSYAIEKLEGTREVLRSDTPDIDEMLVTEEDALEILGQELASRAIRELQESNRRTKFEEIIQPFENGLGQEIQDKIDQAETVKREKLQELADKRKVVKENGAERIE